MSIDRCDEVRKIIQSKFTSSYETITQEIPEDNGWYHVTVRAASPNRGGELRQEIQTALSAAGFKWESKCSSFWEPEDPTLPAIEQVTIERYSATFSVEVGGVRSL